MLLDRGNHGSSTRLLMFPLMGSQECLEESKQDCSALLDALHEARVVDALVATLKHKSPFCVAAAAGALWCLAETPGVRGRELVQASGAIAALVDVIKRQLPPGDPQREGGLFCRCAHPGIPPVCKPEG